MLDLDALALADLVVLSVSSSASSRVPRNGCVYWNTLASTLHLPQGIFAGVFVMVAPVLPFGAPLPFFLAAFREPPTCDAESAGCTEPLASSLVSARWLSMVRPMALVRRNSCSCNLCLPPPCVSTCLSLQQGEALCDPWTRPLLLPESASSEPIRCPHVSRC